MNSDWLVGEDDYVDDAVENESTRIFSDRDQDSPEVLEIAAALQISPKVVVSELVYQWNDDQRCHTVSLPCSYYAFYASQFHGNCGMMVVHSISVFREMPCIEIVARKIAETFGYTILIATDHATPQYGTSIRVGLGKRGWTEVPDLTFTNRRTGRDLVTMMVRVR